MLVCIFVKEVWVPGPPKRMLSMTAWQKNPTINIHAPTANLGFSLVLGLLVVVCLYRVYKCFWPAKWCRLGGGEGKERDRLVVPPSTTIDMAGFHGQVAPKQLAVYRDWDAKNAFWQLREDLCSDCMESLPGGGAGRLLVLQGAARWSHSKKLP